MAQQFVGIDLGSKTVRCVVSTAGFRGVQVVTTYEAEVPPAEGPTDRDARSMAPLEAAFKLLRANGLDRLPAGIALSGNLASARVLKFPFADGKRIAQVLPFEFEEQLPKPLHEYKFDHASTATRDGGVAVAVAVPRDVTAALVERCATEGLDLRLLTTTPAALAQTQMGPVEPYAGELVDDEEAPTPTALVIDIGSRSSELSALTDKGLVAVRSVRRGGQHLTVAFAREYRVPEDRAETMKRESAFLPHAGLPELTEQQRTVAVLTETSLEVIFREIELTRIWLRNELGCEMTEIRLAGSSVSISGFAAYLQDRVDLPVREVAPLGKITGESPSAGWGNFCSALGASIGAARRPLIRLDDASAVERDAGWMQRQFYTLVGVGFAVCALAGVDSLAKQQALERQAELLSEELSIVTQQYFGESFSTKSEIEAAVLSVGGADLTKAIPTRGALEVLNMVALAATPSDLGAAPTVEGVANPVVAAVTPAGPVDPTGALIPPGVGTGGDAPPPEGEAVEAGSQMIDNNAGIVVSDALEFGSIDLRERKMELKLSATRASAQDRLAIQLELLACVQGITKGRIVDRNERKV
ncbi:MAG: pilus assembly protein PilM, partial [Nannocystaceae bacterium]